MDSVLRDIRFGARTLWKDRSFALSTILTLALCIGGNVAMFTIVYSTVLQPIPVPDANRILLMAEQLPKAGLGTADVTFASEYLDRVREMTVFEDEAAFSTADITVDIENVPQQVPAMMTTPSLFRLLKITPVAWANVHRDGRHDRE
ncbi:MAG TPA: hypothetical protein VKE96_07305 [Vicinamibacterales bacterium]|nr:hypothetical protein [Vicinamibacterales bacterium]